MRHTQYPFQPRFLANSIWCFLRKSHFLTDKKPALRTAPVQLKEAAADPVAFALYGDAISPSSSSDMAVVRLILSSSEICNGLEILEKLSFWLATRNSASSMEFHYNLYTILRKKCENYKKMFKKCLAANLTNWYFLHFWVNRNTIR